MKPSKATGTPWMLWLGLLAGAAAIAGLYLVFPPPVEIIAPQVVAGSDPPAVEFAVKNRTSERVSRRVRISAGAAMPTKGGKRYRPGISREMTVSVGPRQTESFRCEFPKGTVIDRPGAEAWFVPEE